MLAWPGLMGPLHKLRRSRRCVCACERDSAPVCAWVRVRGRVRVSLWNVGPPCTHVWNAGLRAVRSGHRVQEQPGST